MTIGRIWMSTRSLTVTTTTTTTAVLVQQQQPLSSSTLSSSTSFETEPVDTSEDVALAVVAATETYNDNNTDNIDDYNDDQHRAIFIISMGTAASKTKLVERFVYTARTKGQYKGWIVLLTDAPSKRYETLQDWNYDHDDDNSNKKTNADTINDSTDSDKTGSGDDRFVIIHPKSEHYNSRFKRKDMTIKRFKTYVLDYINMLEEGEDDEQENVKRHIQEGFRNVRLIYYLDVDIVFADSLSTVFHGLESTYGIGRFGTSTTTTSSKSKTNNSNKNQKVHTSAYDEISVPVNSTIWMFEGNYKNTPIQGGQMILDRTQSMGCLKMWRSLMDSRYNVKKDQVPLLGMYHTQLGHIEQNKPLDCRIIKMEQSPYISFPNREDVYDRVKDILHFQANNNTTIRGAAPAINPSTLSEISNNITTTTSSTYSHRYTNMVHVRNTARIGTDLNETFHKIWLRDILDLKLEDDDPLGLTEPGHMEALRHDVTKRAKKHKTEEEK
jgi:hypothetical protein